MKTILFKNNGISPGIKNKPELKKFLISIFKKEEVEFDRLTYVFCKDQYVLNLNQHFLKQDTFTDTLTFILSESTSAIISEIYISVERVKENAVSFKTDYLHELLRVLIHGILHLCGYLDNTPTQKARMRNKENFYLPQFSFT